MNSQENPKSVLVLGGGIAGIQSALDLAESGIKVYLVEKSPSIGGRMAQLDKTFPTNDCSICILAPKMAECYSHPNIDVLTYSELSSLEGESGNFNATVVKKARFVIEDKCTGCGECSEVCPIDVDDEFNMGLNKRKAIYRLFPQAVPNIFCIDKTKIRIVKGKKKPGPCIDCKKCVKACQAEAINPEMENEEVTLNVGAVIIATGFQEISGDTRLEYGYGKYPDVITALQMERMLSASGPFEGELKRLSDDSHPHNISFIQCAGSRDCKTGKSYCSSVCCMYAVKEAIIAKEHDPDLDITIFYMDMRSFGKEFDDYIDRASNEYGITLVRARAASVGQDETGRLFVTAISDDDVKDYPSDLVVLSTAIEPSSDTPSLAAKLGIETDPDGFIVTPGEAAIDTSTPSIYVCGLSESPKDIPDTVAQASAAAARAAEVVVHGQEVDLQEKVYPPEKDVKGEEPRIGVFVCNCGINIGGIVNVDEVVGFISKMPGVAYAEGNLYSCSQDALAKIKKTIEEKDLNRVVVASCTPRTHEPLFRETCKEAGLNQYLFEMANIRDQCSWVHMQEKEEATEKAKDLVKMAVAKSMILEPLDEHKLDVTKKGLVLGGGITGMTAALSIAEQGFPVTLVEKTEEIGGLFKDRISSWDIEDPQKVLADLKSKLTSNDNVTILTNSSLADCLGYVGNFDIMLDTLSGPQEIRVGAIVVATGSQPFIPKQGDMGYGLNEKVITLDEAEKSIKAGASLGKNIAFMLCAGSRVPDRPYCSRFCCTASIDTVLNLIERDPSLNITVFYRDIRTYGQREELYNRALEKGIKFIRYDPEDPLQIDINENEIKINTLDTASGIRLEVKPDTLILATGLEPSPENEEIAKKLKVPLSKDKFFLEAHMKLRPLDFATDGIYLAGSAQWPKSLSESASQARGAAARVATILSKDNLWGEGAVAVVDQDKCVKCGVCVSVCPYHAVTLSQDHAEVNPALCKGCGTCAATCIKNAISVGHFRSPELYAQVEALLKEVDA